MSSRAGVGAADVRMRGFAERKDVEEVLALLREGSCALDQESVSLASCAGRVLASEIASPVDVPAFERAAMDGYALRGEDTFGASAYDPVTLQLIGESMPGRPYPGEVSPGQAVRIMTGAPIPLGADSVVVVEVCREIDGAVELTEAVSPRKNVGSVGEDIRRAETVLEAGRRIRPQDVGLLASIGVASVPCVRRPRVELLITGDELLPAGSKPEGACIVDSNSPVLQALVDRDGGVQVGSRILPDRMPDLRDAMTVCDADVLLISGGSSVGKEDYAPGLVEELGTLLFHGVSMRPSSPAGGGRLGETRVFLLPGNPVSCLCAYEFFAGPTLRALGGRSRSWPHRRRSATLARKISSQIGRTDYVRVAFDGDRVLPLAISGAAILSSTVRAAGAVIVPRGLEGLAEGEVVEVFLYDDEDAPLL